MGMLGRKKPLSPRRRAVRWLVWMSFAVVAWMRWSMPLEPMPRFGNPGQGFGGGPNMNGRWRRGRAPSPKYKPVTAMPKDFYRVEIEVSRADFEKLLQYHWNGWRGGGGSGDRPEVKVTVREGGVTYTDVALR